MPYLIGVTVQQSWEEIVVIQPLLFVRVITHACLRARDTLCQPCCLTSASKNHDRPAQIVSSVNYLLYKTSNL